MLSVFLDEFGHIGPYNPINDARHSTSPVFGVAGFLIEDREVRELAKWFYHLKCARFESELEEAGKHPGQWEKKGNQLFTASKGSANKRLGYSLLNKIAGKGGKVFYYGVEKPTGPDAYKISPKDLYIKVMGRALKQIERYAAPKGGDAQFFQVIQDQHPDRAGLILAALTAMHARNGGAWHLVEPPYEVESHLYSTVQMADWIASIVGSLHNFRAQPFEFKRDEWAEILFGDRLNKVTTLSSIYRYELTSSSRRMDRPSPNGS